MNADLDLNGFDLINVGSLFLDGDIIEADVIADYVDFNEASEPANPSANTARLYAKDDGGLTKLYYKDSSGIEYLVSAPVFDIREYGAVGDGTTDDTTAIAAAIAAVPSTGGVVFVPTGTFLFKSTLRLKSKTLLTGQGWGSILKGDDIALSGNARIGIRESATSNVDMAVINLCVDISALEGDSGGHKAIQFNDSSRIRVEGCRIITTATGIAHVNCSFYKVINNKVEVTAGTADGGIDNWWGSHDAIIIGNHVDGNDSLQQGILFTGTDTTEGLSTPCYNLVISNNIVQHCTENGIWLQGKAGGIHTAIVEGNTIEDTSDGSNGFGVRLSQCDRVILRGNHIKDTQLSGICLRGEGGTTVTDCVVSGNIVEGANKSTGTGIDGAAIQLGAGGATGHLVIGNKIYGSLHARAIDIAANANNNHVIGNYCAAGTQGTIRDQGTSNTVQLNRGAGDYREVLTVGRNYYVRTDGSDSNTGLADSSGGAFLTLQKAIDIVHDTLDLNGHSVTINVGAGTFTGGVLVRGPFTGWADGAASVTVDGAGATTIVSTTSATCFDVREGAELKIQDVKVQTTTSGNCLQAQKGGRILVQGVIEFGACAGFHVDCSSNSYIQLAPSTYTISGGAVGHHHVGGPGNLVVNPTGTITLTGTPAFSVYFAGVAQGHLTYQSSAAFSGSGTGRRFFVHKNGTIDVSDISGSGVTTLPGDSAGTANSGGVYQWGTTANEVIQGGLWRILAAGAVAVSHTGNTNETTLATITVPAGAIGANGQLRVTTLWSVTNSANNKTIRVRLGGLSGTSFLNNILTSSATYSDQRVIRNRNSASSQVCTNINSPAGGFGASTSAVTTGTIDTSSAQDIVITAQLANSGETITLEAYTVELFASA